MRLATVLLLALFATSARAGTTFLDLDTNPGSFSTWKTSTDGAASLSFKATFAAAYTHKTWAPTYTLTLSDGADHALVLKGTLQAKGAPTVAEATLKRGASTSSEASHFALALGQPRRVQVSWRPGTVAVSVDGATQEYRVDFTPSQVAMSCSTGELVVEDIAFAPASGT